MNLTELKRLAEAATAGPWKVKDRKVVTTEDAAICCSPVFRIGAYKQSMANTEYFAAASPDVTLQMIAEIDRLRLHIKHIGNDALRTQNQALVEALKEARTIMVLHRDFLDLKSSATWQLAIDPIDEVLAQAEGGV